MFDVFYLGKKPNLFVHEQPAVDIQDAAHRCRTRYFWVVNYLSDYSGWDWLWEPVPWQAGQRHAWASQWQKDSGTYLVPREGYTDTNYHADPVIQRLPSSEHWYNCDLVSEFDYSWHPDPTEPDYVYVFGTNYHDQGGPEYRVPSAVDPKYVSQPRAQLEPSTANWQTCVNVDSFDWSWRPHPMDPPYIYVFGNQWHSATVMPTVEYHVPGATERKYMNTPCATLPKNPNRLWYDVIPDCDWDYSWVPDPGDPPYIYVFGNQWWPAEKMPTVEYRVPGATERKYVTWPRVQLTPSLEHWTVPDTLDVSDFDFSWQPDPGAPAYIYQFATQHQKTGGPVYTVPGATEVKYLSEIKSRTTRVATAIYEIDHLDEHAGKIKNTTRRVRYFDNYRDTLIRLAKSIGTEHEYVWVCSSICDYTGFDFSWHPEAWQSTMLHVFASNEQKFGDTFFMHVPTFAESAEKKALLDWYDVNYVPSISVPRRSMPVIYHKDDTHVDVVKRTDWAGPLAVFTVEHVPAELPTVSLWRQETKTIVPLSTGASAVIVPKTAQGHVRTQLYDYAYIDKTRRKPHSDRPLDIVFISNGEPNAETNWGMVSRAVDYRPNQLHRVDGINGRVAAYHAAARASTTPWFFAVFAKLAVNPEFDWYWQPDRMQEPKHYIFHARNPVNGLEYGHQAMIAYNRDLVLANSGHGLDFTLDSAHEVVPMMSGTAYYSYTPWMAWRTAFREVLKLCASTDVESQYRLKQWLDPDTNGIVEHGQWSVLGAEDAVEYYDSVNGDFEQLRKSYDWAWLASYVFVKRGLVPD
jgi:hypothetical protein